MRGLKRKKDDMDGEKSEYKENLSHFQTMARNRESVRLKNQCLLPNSTPGYWENHLNEKIHVEAQMMRGAAKFLTACKNEDQALEAAKRLQLGKLRMDMLKYEVNKIKRGGGSPSNSAQGLARPSYAGVSVSDVRIPLMWKRKDHLNDSGDRRRFAVFCLARIGAQIYDSSLICPVDRSHTDINLQDVFLFNKVSAHFEVTIEVYAKLLKSDSNTASSLVKDAENILGKTPQKLVQSISKAVGKKLLMHNVANILKEEEKNPYSPSVSDTVFKVGPKFEMIATVTLRLDECSKDVETHELYIEDPSGDNCPPMFGAICCRLAALPYCCEDPVMSGNFQIQRLKGPTSIQDFSVKRQVFATLIDWKLSVWSCKDQKDSARKAMVSIPVTRDTCILEDSEDCITITNGSCTWIVNPEKDVKQKWLMNLLQHAADHRRWKTAALKKLALGSLSEIDTKNTAKKPRYTKSFKRTRSKLHMLYNETGLGDELI